MTAEQIIGLSLALLIMCVGLAGSILPGIPSTPLVLLAAIGHRLYFGETVPGNWALIILVAITAFLLLVDYLASMYGAKRLGATWRGVFGAVVGGLVGIFFNLPGILLGPFIGAVVFEMAGGRKFKEAGRTGLGATLGLLGGAVAKLGCCVAMMGLFAVNVIQRCLNQVPA